MAKGLAIPVGADSTGGARLVEGDAQATQAIGLARQRCGHEGQG